jgi:porin
MIALAVVTGGEGRAQEDNGREDYQFAALYTADLWRNASGGLRTGSAYLDNLDLTLAVDGESAWGMKGISAFAYVLYTNDGRLSERLVGDAMTVSNIDAPAGLRLYEAWVQWTGGAKRPLSLRFGLYDLNSEFDTSESRSLFIHSSHGVGHEFGQTGKNGPSIFPVTSLGLRLAWELAPQWRLQAVVLDGVPGERDHPDRSGIYLSSEEGMLGVAELQWSRGRVRKLSVGYWSYTARFADVRSSEASSLPRRRDNAGAYGELELGLKESDSGAAERSAFVRYGVANGRINEFDRSVSVGVRSRELIRSRHGSEIGLAFTRARISPQSRDAAAMAGVAREGYEAAIELTYRASINDWLTIQPDVQYIFNPGADSLVRDSIAIGVRFELSAAAFR